MKISFLILFGLLQFVSLGLAEQQSSRFSFRLFSTEHGLSSAEIYSILQDRAGYLWIGTTNGLHRFDGYTFSVFRNIPFDTASLSSHFISSLCEDRNGNIWIVAAGQGINKLNVRTGKVTRFFHQPDNPTSLSDDECTRVFCDTRGNIWVGTASGTVDVIEPISGNVHRIVLHTTDTTYAIRSFAQDREGTVWIAATNKVFLVDSQWQSKEFQFFPDVSRNGTIAHSLLYVDSSHSLWLGSSGKLWKYDPGVNRFHHIPFPGESASGSETVLMVMKEEQPGIFWIATNTDIFRFHSNSQKAEKLNAQENYPSQLQNILPRTLHIDKTGIVWIGFGVYGLLSVQSLDPHIITVGLHQNGNDGLPHRYVRGLAEDRKKNLWIGTFRGMTRLDSSLTRFTDFPTVIRTSSGKEVNQINALFVDEKNTMWIGTNTDGLFTYSLTTGNIRHLLGSSSILHNAEDDIVYDIYQDRRKRFWIGTKEGGVVVLNANGKFLRRFNRTSTTVALPHNNVRAVVHDHRGNIWIGTFGGVCLLNETEDSMTVFTTDEHNPATLSNPRVLAMYEDRQGNICIGTSGGLNILNPRTNIIRHYTNSTGFVNDIVVGITEDTEGNLWVSTYGGLVMLDSAGNIRRTLFEADGLQNDLFNSGATIKLHSGKIAFGGAYGMNIISPATLQAKSFIPSVVVHAFTATNKSVAQAISSQEDGSMTMEPNESSVRFEFAALDFRFPRGNMYAYTLEGLETEWTTTSTRRNVTYANLGAGEYVFKVKAAGRDGIWTEHAALITLTVIPPIWERWWFVPSIVAAIALLIFALYRSLLIKQLLFERMRIRIAADLHDEIGSGLARIAVLSDIVAKMRMKKHTRAKGAEVMEHAPVRIGIISRELLESIQDVVWSLDPNNDTSTNVFDRIQSFANQLAEENGIAISIEAKNTLPIHVDLHMKRALLLIAKESLTNIARHAKAKNISVALQFKKNTLLMTIHDDGVGFIEEQLTRVNGLTNMRRRATAAGGVCRIHSERGKGTVITVSFVVEKEGKNYTNVQLMFTAIRRRLRL
ncbi:MAG: hypothetical protein M0R68_04210 [Bacteroidetes bacterium]|nr:hypothetical protein [Bacteroidota bacterium]